MSSPEHGLEFRRKLQSDEFKNLTDAKKYASNIFKLHSDEYKPDRATVKRDNGAISRRRTQVPDEDISNAINIAKFRQKITEIIRDNYGNFMKLGDLGTVRLQGLLTGETDAHQIMKEIHGDKEPSKKETRLIENTLKDVLNEAFKIDKW